MNTGLQDAHNLANLLADGASGLVDAAALERYEAERRPVARNLVTVTDRVFGVIAGRGRRVAWLRRRLARVVAAIAPRMITGSPGPWLGGLLGQYRIRYHGVADGEPVPRWARDRAVGLRLPPTAENAEALRAMTWQLHGYGVDAERPACAPEWIEGPFCFPPDALGRLRRDRLHLVRPDGYVAASWPLHAGAAAEADVREALAAYEIRL